MWNVFIPVFITLFPFNAISAHAEPMQALLPKIILSAWHCSVGLDYIGWRGRIIHASSIAIEGIHIC